MENGLLLPLNRHLPVITSSIFLRRCLHFQFTTTSHHHIHHHHDQILRISLIASSSRKWDSNAETFRSRNFKFKFNQNDDEEEEEEDEGFAASLRKKKKWYAEVFEEITESIWIIKVFKSFGLFLPFIIISFLLATGPKAFLMALGPSLAISILSLAFEKLRGKTRQHKPKRKAKTRKKSYSRSSSGFKTKEGQKDERQETKKGRRVNEYRMGSNNGAFYKGNADEPVFGGWDDLYAEEFMRETSAAREGSQGTENGKLSGLKEKSEVPLLVRLLIALFPFIGSWAEMFW